MPKSRAEVNRSSANVSLHIGASSEAAWENVVRPWFEKISETALRAVQPAAVVTASWSQAHFFRDQLLAENKSLIGVKFLSPPQLREILLRERGLRAPLREHLRLLLAVTAEEFATESIDPPSLDYGLAGNDAALVAKSIARDPDHFLRALDQLGAAGWSVDEIDSPALREIAARFQQQARKCGFTFVYDADRAAVREAEKSQPFFSNLLLFGFDAAHWPLWPLLRAAAFSSIETTVVLDDPRDEARDVDETWVATWEETFQATETIAAADTRSTSPFAQLLEQPPRTSKRKTRPAGNDKVHFFMGRDTTEQARAIAALTVAFLSEPSFEQLAILLPGPGALARLTASWLERLRIPYDDGIAHQMRGAFDDEEWRAWIELQRQPRIGPLLRFLRQSPAAAEAFQPLPLPKIEDTLQRACGDILINAVDVLREYCSRRTDEKNYGMVATGLDVLNFLPEQATFPAFLKQTLSIFRSLKWRERAAELERLSRDLGAQLAVEVSRDNFVRWLSDVFAESSLARDEHGDHPYARVHLLPYDQAKGAAWSHAIFAGLNQGVWPPSDDESPFLPDDVIAALNERNKQTSARFGEGPRVAREGTTLCLSARERRALAVRQLLNMIESTTQSIGVTADLYTYAPREQTINPSEFYAQLFFRARGEALSQRQIAQLHQQTQRWLAHQEFLQTEKPRDVDLAQTERAYRARRSSDIFGEYEFAFRETQPPPEQVELSATDLANAMKRPALVWMKTFLGVESDEIDERSWNLATGQWVHRWLATIGAEPRANQFVPRLPGEQLTQRVVAGADEFRDLILSILTECGRPLPDWWQSGWRNARHLAEQFAKQIAAATDWPLVATEWKLDSPTVITLENEQLRVRGRVDLILTRDETSKEFWIVDYKTGEAQPLKSKPAEVRKQLAAGDGVQICVYLFALRKKDRQIIASLLTRGAELAAQVTLADVESNIEIWSELARMEKTGIFGMLGELRSEFTFTGTYPLATLVIDRDLLKQKWERTHPAFAKPREK